MKKKKKTMKKKKKKKKEKEEEEEEEDDDDEEEEEKRKRRAPSKEPSLKVPFIESLAEICPTTGVLFHSPIKVPGIRDPPTYQVPLGWKRGPIEKDARIRRLS
jgi:hypothetical protein